MVYKISKSGKYEPRNALTSVADDNNQGTPIHPNDRSKGLERSSEKSSNYIGPQVHRGQKWAISNAVTLRGISRFIDKGHNPEISNIVNDKFVNFPFE